MALLDKYRNELPSADAGSTSLLNKYRSQLPAAKPTGNVVSDTVLDVGKGALKLPSAVTGLVDTAAGLVGIDRPASRLADKAGQATGFTPEKWANETPEAAYSPERQQANQAVDAVWKDPNAGALDVAKTYVQNPRAVLGTVAESLPSMVAGNALGKAVVGVDAALPTNELIKRATLAGGVGEGAVMAGQAMENIDHNVDPQKAATAAALTGGIGGLIGTQSGRIANKLGLSDVDTALIAGRQGLGSAAVSMPKRIIAGAIQEGPIEEGSQSAAETALQNYAEDKPLTEGMARNVVEGSLAGVAMGGPMGAFDRGDAREATPVIVPSQAERQAEAQAQAQANPTLANAANVAVTSGAVDRHALMQQLRDSEEEDLRAANPPIEQAAEVNNEQPEQSANSGTDNVGAGNVAPSEPMVPGDLRADANLPAFGETPLATEASNEQPIESSDAKPGSNPADPAGLQDGEQPIGKRLPVSQADTAELPADEQRGRTETPATETADGRPLPASDGKAPLIDSASTPENESTRPPASAPRANT
jgi:hypothetical protein